MTSCQKNVAEGGIELCMQFFFFVQTKILQIAVQSIRKLMQAVWYWVRDGD